MKLSVKMLTALNAQIVEENYAAYLYFSMASWLEVNGYLGAAHWMKVQGSEELSHAIRIYTHISERGNQVKLGAIKAPPFEWSSPLNVFQEAYKHEKTVTASFNNLCKIAREENDNPSLIFLQWFVMEQVEEEASFSEIITKFELVGKTGPGFYIVDQELAARILDAESKLILAI